MTLFHNSKLEVSTNFLSWKTTARCSSAKRTQSRLDLVQIDLLIELDPLTLAKSDFEIFDCSKAVLVAIQ